MKSTNINWESQYASTIKSFKSCVSPSDLKPPTLNAVTQTSYKISWDAPENDGGCPITKYEVYRDEGDGGDMDVLVSTITSGNLELEETNLDNPPSLTGKRIWIMIIAFNEIGIAELG